MTFMHQTNYPYVPGAQKSNATNIPRAQILHGWIVCIYNASFSTKNEIFEGSRFQVSAQMDAEFTRSSFNFLSVYFFDSIMSDTH